MTLDALEAALLRVLDRLPPALLDALDGAGYGVIAAPAPPDSHPRALGLCDRQVCTIFLYASLFTGGDDQVERTLRHEIAHALGMDHGPHMRELGLHR